MKPDFKSALLKKKVGAPPGTLIHTGEHSAEPVTLTAFSYNEAECLRSTPDLESVLELSVTENHINWFNLDGIHDVSVIRALGQRFHIHNLLLEDVVNSRQRPKIEITDTHIFVCLKMLVPGAGGKVFRSEHISLILGDHYVLSFQEQPGDVFDVLRQRLSENLGRIRKEGADYLFYCLLDILIDNYFPVMNNFSDQIEELEDLVFNDQQKDHSRHIYSFKKDLISLYLNIRPLKELISVLQRDDCDKFIGKNTGMYLNDLQDHITQIKEYVESSRDLVSGIFDTYMSLVGSRMNAIMKVLTLIATIFIPLTFIAGIYGMNFENMPELSWPLGYFAALSVMGVCGIVMVVYFKIKRWF